MRPALLIILLLIFSSNVAFADDDLVESLEAEVKAAFVHNFFKFIAWPEDNEGESNRPDKIIKAKPITSVLIIGDSLLAVYLREYVADSDDNRKITIKYSDTLISNNNFDAIYFSSKNCSDYSKVPDEYFRGNEMLTISDCDKFISSGGIIELFLIGSRVRFSINKTEADKVGLTISSRLLKLAVNIE